MVTGKSQVLDLGGLPPPRMLTALPNLRLLAVCGDDADTIIVLGEEDTVEYGLEARSLPPTLVMGGYGPIQGICAPPSEDVMFVSIGSSVYRVALDPSTFTPSAQSGTPEEHLNVAPGYAGALALDTLGNVYVCTPEGVQVCDENGELRLTVSTPQPASGICLGGPGTSVLYVTCGGQLWIIQTNVQGAVPPSQAFMKMIGIQTAQGDFRHVGW